MLDFNSPLSATKADHLVALLDLSPAARVIEIGCGNGVLLNKIIKHYNAFGLGIDLDPELICQARESASSLIDKEYFEYRAGDINTEEIPPASFDAAVCNGASHAYGSGSAAYVNTLMSLSQALKLGGILLIGEIYWKKQPDKEYLDFIGDPAGVYNSFEENIFIAEKYGFDALFATSSNQDEWDNFEWSHKQNIRKLVCGNPQNDGLQMKKSRIDNWIKGYLRWGRATMGYGFYIFTKVR